MHRRGRHKQTREMKEQRAAFHKEREGEEEEAGKGQTLTDTIQERQTS